MGRFKARRKGQAGEGSPSKGLRRSIRFDAEQEWPEDPPSSRAPDAPPAILLRLLPLEEALHRLAAQLRAYAGQGCGEVLVVHGKGSNSRGGVSVLGPAVREWCSRNVDVVASWREAPGKWGGAGAIVVTLR